MRLALYEPDIPQNAGSLMRLGACLGVGVDIIEPCGFLLSDRNFRRAGMDYLQHADIRRHESWTRFRDNFSANRVDGWSCSPPAEPPPIPISPLRPIDTLMVGRESAGVPDAVHAGGRRQAGDSHCCRACDP